MKTREIKTTYTRTVYIAEDGKEFSSAGDCKEYEFRLKFNKIKTADTDKINLSPFFESPFYYIDSEESLEAFNAIIGKETVNDYTVKVGDWVTFKFEYNSNAPDEYRLITLEEVWNGMIELMNKTEFAGDN